MRLFKEALELLQTHEATAPFLKNVKTEITIEHGLYYEFDALVPCFIFEKNGRFYDIQDTLDPMSVDLERMNYFHSPIEVAQHIIDTHQELQES